MVRVAATTDLMYRVRHSEASLPLWRRRKETPALCLSIPALQKFIPQEEFQENVWEKQARDSVSSSSG